MKYVLPQLFLALFLAFLFLTVFPLTPSFLPNHFNQQRLVQSTFLVLVVSFYIVFSRKRSCYFNSLRTPLLFNFGVWLFFVGGLLSIVFSSDPLNAFMYCAHIAVLFTVMLAIATSMSGKYANYFVLCFVFAHCSLISYCLLNVCFALMSSDSLNPTLIYFGFDNIRFFNQVQVFALPFLIFCMTSSRFKSLAAMYLFLNLFFIFLGGGLGVVLAWLIIVVFHYLFSKDMIVVKWSVVITCLAFLAFYMLSYVASLSSEKGRAMMDISSGGRVELWSNTLSQIDFTHVFFGLGPSIYRGETHGNIFGHPHNSLLEVFTEWGGISFIGVICIVLSCFKTLFVSNASLRSDSFKLSLVLAWLGGLSYSFVSGVLVMPVPQTLFFLIWGLVLSSIYESRASYASSHKQVPNNAKGFRRIILFFVGSPPLVGLITASLLVVYAIMVLYSFYQIGSFDGAVSGPRFWLDGRRYL